MAEYIDRTTFITEKREQYCRDCDRRKGMKKGKLKFCYEIGEAPCRSCGVDDALSDIEDYPAADVVEVVRCKNCDLWNEWDESGHKKLGNYACSCAYFSNEDGYMVYTGPDDYCSYGERKEDKA